ncbi:MAG: amidase, partial [Gemmobacter sp.]
MKGFEGLDATALAALVARRETSAGELLDAALASVAALNPALNAVVLMQEDAARVVNLVYNLGQVLVN